MIIRFQPVHPNALCPTRATEGSAGWDLYLTTDVSIGPEPSLVDLGFRLEIPFGWEASIRPRSSLYKKSIWIPNAPATIDSDYRGSVHIVLVSHRYATLSRGDRIAQMLFSPVPEIEWVKTDLDLSPTTRGEGGFGSSGR